MTLRRSAGVLVLLTWSLGAVPTVRGQVPTQMPTPLPPQAGSFELALEQGRRLFDSFDYDEAIPVFDQLIATLMSGDQIQQPDILVQAYELRGRAHFALGTRDAAEQDFAALLRVRPEFRLAEDVSPRVVAVFEEVRNLTVGQVLMRLSPPGDLAVDRRTYTVPPEGAVIDLTAGDHLVSVTRTNYAPITQTISVTAGEARDLDLVMIRIAASLDVLTVQEGVEVLIDGVSRGTTESQASGAASLRIDELGLGAHDLRLVRDCYVDVVRTVTLRAEDLRTEPILLERAIAVVRVETAARGATVLVDGEARSSAPGTVEVCEGPHVIEVRGPSGRFIDRREWRTGDDVTLDARLRSAFPIVSVTGPGEAAVLRQLRADVERVLAPASALLAYAPDEDELQTALRAENVPTGWLVAAMTGAPDALPADAIREMGRRLGARLGVQGFIAVAGEPERFAASVGILAVGSGRPELVRFSTADPVSQRAALARLDAPLPSIVRPSLDSVVIDVAAVQGAVVVRPGGAGSAAGLVVGDVIVGAAGQAVGSVADLRTVMAELGAGALDLDVLGRDGQIRRVAASPTAAVDLLPLSDASVLYNRALLELREQAQSAVSPAGRTAAHVNLAVVLLRLGNWDEALQSLGQAGLQDGVGVSGGTVAYLRGLALEGMGRMAEAQSAFSEAAADPTARLGRDGPLVAPIAREKLSSGGVSPAADGGPPVLSPPGPVSLAGAGGR